MRPALLGLLLSLSSLASAQTQEVTAIELASGIPSPWAWR